MTLVQADRLLPVPVQEDPQPLARVLAAVVVDLTRIAEQEIERGPRNGALASDRLESAGLRPSAARARVPVRREIEVERVRAELTSQANR